MAHTGLTGKVVLVTGANNPMGIGAATAKAFARQGAQVFITYLRLPPEWEHPFSLAPEPRDTPIEELGQATEPGWAMHNAMRMKSADDVLEAIRQEGGTVAAWEADLANADNIPALFERVESEFGPVDVLVNNACHACSSDMIEHLTLEVIDRTYAVNTRATLLLTAEYVRRYKKSQRRWGRIVNISTGPAQHFSTQVAYGSSKAAIEASTRAAAAALGPLGITVNTVAPGATQTGYIDRALEESLLPTIPLRRLGQPEDIAHAIVFLCSDQAGFITGQVLRVTGGRDMW